MRRIDTRDLPPASFSFVMATGIVAVGAHLHGFVALASTLMAVALAGAVVIGAATGHRILAHRDAVARDLHDPTRAFGFFTAVAATGVLAVCATALGWVSVALALLAVAAGLWLVLGYAVPWFTVLGRGDRPALRAAGGSWFLWVVASQSIAVVAAGLQPLVPGIRDALAVLAVFTWSVGMVSYVAVAVLVTIRLLMFAVDPVELDPTYWVAMGALAITVVAGSRIVEMTQSPIVGATRGVVAGLAVVLWSFASWLVPALVCLGVWRHMFRGVPVGFTPALWSVVFPLGMYAVAGMYLGHADHLPFVGAVGAAWFWVGLTAWVVCVGAGLRQVRRQGRPGEGTSSTAA